MNYSPELKDALLRRMLQTFLNSIFFLYMPYILDSNIFHRANFPASLFSSKNMAWIFQIFFNVHTHCSFLIVFAIFNILVTITRSNSAQIKDSIKVIINKTNLPRIFWLN